MRIFGIIETKPAFVRKEGGKKIILAGLAPVKP